MTDDIRQSLSRLGQISLTDLDAASAELTTLLAALHKEFEVQATVIKNGDASDPACHVATGALGDVLSLTQAAMTARNEVSKLAAAAGKAVNRVLKKAPK